ncbi:uncharacterized protein LOC125425276 [Sphaerodactylus townsendi]|uniref:uncharacterized protein LOC125425276 n=1 Tax=Sphaerodactylus townsendi TaxID=933632 RepID=UPI002025D2DE|nr:uncharacterized protein LOC125425276 [Sphaerodactylus townsendi]
MTVGMGADLDPNHHHYVLACIICGNSPLKKQAAILSVSAKYSNDVFPGSHKSLSYKHQSLHAAHYFAHRVLGVMALSTGRNEICSSVIQRHFQPGMEELVSFAQCLVDAGTDLSTCHNMNGHILKASQEMGEALQELQGGLSTIDTKSAQLVAQKKHLEGEREAQAEKLRSLRHQMDSHKSLESRSKGMLETAKRHLEEMQRQLSQKEDEARYNEMIRNVGIGLMFIPIVGMIPGGVMVGCGQVALDAAQNAKREAEDEVNRHSAEVVRCMAEIDRCQTEIREAEAEIQASENRLSSIEWEKQQLTSEQAEVVTLQNSLRKCVTFLDVLSGKVDTAELLTHDVVIYHELERVLEDIVNHVFPLMGQGNQMCVMALSTSEIRVLVGRLKCAREQLSLEGPSSGLGNVAIDF